MNIEIRRRLRPTILFALAAGCFAPAVFAATEPATPTVTVQLENGSVLIGSILEETAQTVRMKVNGIGEIDVQAAAIVERNEGTLGVLQVPVQGVPPEEAPAPTAGAPQGVKWTRTLTLGGNFTSAQFKQGELEGSVGGVTGRALGLPGSQVSAQARLTLQRTTPSTDWWLGASATYVDAQPRGLLANSKDITSDLRHHLNPRLYILGLTTFSTDKVRRISDSVSQIVGLGHRFVDTPRYRFDLVGGVEAQRADNGTQYDGDVLEGFGFVETFHFGNDKGVGLDQRVVLKTVVQDLSLYSMDSYIGLNAPMTKHLALTVSLLSKYDRMLNLRRTDIPANAFYPGSPAASFYANTPWSNQLTTGVQVRF